MQFDYVSPPLPTIARWRRLYRDYGRESVLRVLQYEALQACPLRDRVLDIGGGRKARYLQYLPASLQLDSINIDPRIDPTHLIEPGTPFPFADQCYDAAICLNTLEHVYDARAVLQEIHRVLKPGATVHITVPFIFRIHAHPDDYFRATPSWWRQTCQHVGFSRLTLQPLVWGRYTTAGMITGYRGLFPRGQFHLAHLKDWLYARTAFRGNRYDGRRGERVCAVAAGWFMAATR